MLSFEMLLRSKTRLKPISSELKPPETDHRDQTQDTPTSSNPENVSTPPEPESSASERSSDQNENETERVESTSQTNVKGKAKKIISSMKKSDLEGLVVRLCGEIKRLQKVLRR